MKSKPGRFIVRALLTILLGSACRSFAQSDTAGPPTADKGVPPKYSPYRWDEDYAYLSDPSNRTDYLDAIKFIPLNATGSNYLSLGGQVRDRYEYFNNQTFGRTKQDDDGYDLFRFTPYADLHLGENLRFFGQLRTDDEIGEAAGPRARDTDVVDIQQAFFELDVPHLFGGDTSKLTARIGRQQMVFGRERLIGISDWSNASRNYDGVRLTLETRANTLDVVYFRPVLIDKYHFDNDDEHTNFVMVYDTFRAAGTQQKPTLEISNYVMALFTDNNATSPAAPGPGTEDRYTLGNEIRASIGDFDFDLENDYQLGNFRGQSIGALSTAEELGYTFRHVQTAPRLFVAFDLATGDHDLQNGHIGTFNQLFPSGHTWFGYMDFVGRQNIIDLHPGVEFTPFEKKSFAQKMTFRAEYHQFWRESLHDAVYDSSGDVLIAPGSATRRGVGGELDLQLKWDVSRHWSTYVGYSHFWPGGFIHQTGSAEQTDFAYGELAYTF